MAQINTKYFGELSYEKEDCILFPDGLFGFEQETEFLLLPFIQDEGSLFCLQSVNTDSLAFVVINPFAFVPDYNPILSQEDLLGIKAESNADVCFYVICVMRDTIETSSANLKCPVIINPLAHLAKQIILEDSNYTFRHYFQSFHINNSKEG